VGSRRGKWHGIGPLSIMRYVVSNIDVLANDAYIAGTLCPPEGASRSVAKKLATLVMAALGVVILAATLDTAAAPGTTTRVSVASDETETYGLVFTGGVSADGRFVAFQSNATNLVSGDTNGKGDIFLRDTQLGITTRVSVDSSGSQGDDHSFNPRVSADGLYVTYQSIASNLVPGDTQGGCDTNNDGIFAENCTDVFVHNRLTGANEIVSRNNSGVYGNEESSLPAISGDGRYVAFVSDASNLVVGDTNGVADIFVRDRQTGTTSRVSVSSQGVQANNLSTEVDIRSTGRFVAFRSFASNLVQGDTGTSCPDTFPPTPGNCSDIFVHDRLTGATNRASVNSNGDQADGQSYYPSVSGDGQVVAFVSRAQNLAPTGGFFTIFVHDFASGLTSRIGPGGDQVSGNFDSFAPSVTDDGRFTAFSSGASNLAFGDSNHRWDVFVHDRVSGVNALVSVSNTGTQGDFDSDRPYVDVFGRFVTFYSQATNLVPNDTNFADDVFLHDLGDSDGDGEWDPFDLTTDSDGDLIANPVEGKCGSNPLSAGSRPERIDTPGDDDGDGLVNEALPTGSELSDCDGDGFSGTVELSVFAAVNTASDQKKCGVNAWPADVNNDGYSDISDVIPILNYFGERVPPTPVRYNIAPDQPDGFVDITDIVKILNYFGSGCA
jgi:WD40-like Beta Propeller Repeat